MAILLNTFESTLLAESVFQARDFKAWNTDISNKQIHVKRLEVLESLRTFYPAKIARIREYLTSGGLDPNNVISLQAKILRLQTKYACVLKELEFRDQKLVTRQVHDTTYYLDFERHTGHLAGIWTWTNESASVTGSSGDATKLAVGDYVRSGTVLTVWGTQWYKVASVVDDNSFTITPVFKQATRTDDTGTAMWSDISEANYGTTIALAAAHFNWYTTDTARTAGDLLYVRANQTHLSAGINVVCDEDGTAANLLEIRGCSVADDPFGDASDVKPRLEFGATAFQVNISNDDFWKLNGLDFRQSSNSSSTLFLSDSYGVQVVACNFQENTHATTARGCYQSRGSASYDNCTFSLNPYTGLFMIGGIAYVNNCTFNGGGGVSTDYGLLSYGGTVYLTNSQFGQTTLHDFYDLWVIYGGQIIHRNCKFAGSNLVTQGSFIFAEDEKVGAAEAYQVHTITTDKGIISRDATVTRAGGATSSAKMAPSSNCGVNNPLILTPDYFVGGAFKVWMAASAAQTITVYIKGYGWPISPVAAQLYVEGNYYDDAAACTRTTLASTNVIDENTNWHPFTVTIPAEYPKRDGFVYVNVYLNKYIVSSGVNVDIKPVIT